jgi:hypothetical protein
MARCKYMHGDLPHLGCMKEERERLQELKTRIEELKI